VLYSLFLFFDFCRVFLAFFGRFLTRGVQKREKNVFFQKKRLLIQKKPAFSLRFFSPPFFSPPLALGYFARFFCRVSGRFTTRGKGSSKTQLRQSQKFFRSCQKTKKSSCLYFLVTYVFFFFQGGP
jgi:hypothetical protein